MQTIYDWLTIALFAGLIVLFLQRSQGDAQDSLWQYLVAAVGCAGTNWLGNKALEDHEILLHVAAVGVFGGTIAYVLLVLRPFGGHRV